MTRPEFIAELLSNWEHTAAKVRREYGECPAAEDIDTAIKVLEMTYTAEEMGVVPSRHNHMNESDCGLGCPEYGSLRADTGGSK